MDIRIHIGERPLARKNQLLTTLSLTGFPPALKGVPQLTVELEVDQFCSVKATAFEGGSSSSVKVESSGSDFVVTPEGVQNALRAAEENKAHDDEELRLAEEKLQRESLMARAEALLRDPGKHAMYNIKGIEKALAGLGLAIEEGSNERARSLMTELENAIGSPKTFDFGDIFADLFGSAGGARKRVAPQPRPTAKASSQASAHRDQPATGPARYHLGRIFGGAEFTPDPNLCFVLMPFREAMSPIYSDHIKVVVEAAGVICQRADELVGTQLITHEIWEKVSRARFLIADLTGRNSNVFYELGLAHALGKEVIMLTQTMDDVPFDLKALRCIVYEFTPRGTKELEKKLRETIQKIMQSG